MGFQLLKKFEYYYNQRTLLFNYVKKDLREKYAGSILGFYWSVINPLILLGIYTFVFSVIFKVKFSREATLSMSALYIYCGMVPWMAFHEAILRSTNTLIDNANLIKKVMFPSKILPIYLTISAFVNMFIGFAILITGAILSGKTNFKYYPLLLLYFFAQFLLTLGFGWMGATVNVFIRDMGQIIGQILLIWMYLTPLFYTMELIPEKFRKYEELNPMALLIKGYRDIILNQKMPDIHALIKFWIISIVIFLIGYKVFTKNQHKFADVL